MRELPDGAFEFWHNDGDLFWGHSILIVGSLEEGLTDGEHSRGRTMRLYL
jgi:hypothetical protein